MASRDFSYDADAGAWEFAESMTTGFEGRKANGTVPCAIGYHSSPILGAQVQESRTEITHFLTGAIATVASLSTWKTSGGLPIHFLPSQENDGCTTLPFVSNPEQETPLHQLGTSPAAKVHGQGSISSPQYLRASTSEQLELRILSFRRHIQTHPI
jgi:hypothetical protein